MTRLFEHLDARQINRGPDQISRFGEGGIEAEWPTKTLPVADDVEHGSDGHARGDLAGVVAAHAVGDHAEAEVFIDREAILIGGPCALVADA
jgi:hypothetical protein